MKNLSRSNFNLLVIFVALSLAIAGCRKDPHYHLICPEETCQNLPTDGSIGSYHVMQGVQFFWPCFNPNNANEFIYIQYIEGSTYSLLKKFNLQTKVHELLYVLPKATVFKNIDWGKQGWILFAGESGGFWKIKDDGTEPTQIINYNGLRPRFGKDGNNFALNKNSVGNNYYLHVFDLNGNIIDSSKRVFGSISIGYPYHATDNVFHNGYFLYNDESMPDDLKIGFCRLTDNSQLQKIIALKSSVLTDMVASDNTIVYSDYWKGLYKLDVNTLQVVKLKTSCETRSYHNLSMSPDGNKILVEKRIIKPLENNIGVEENHEIWLLDINSCEEVRVLGK